MSIMWENTSWDCENDLELRCREEVWMGDVHQIWLKRDPVWVNTIQSIVRENCSGVNTVLQHRTNKVSLQPQPALMHASQFLHSYSMTREHDSVVDRARSWGSLTTRFFRLLWNSLAEPNLLDYTHFLLLLWENKFSHSVQSVINY